MANRIGEIQDHTTIDNWHWVPNCENVADDASVITNPAVLVTNGLSLFFVISKKEQCFWSSEKCHKPMNCDEVELKREFVNVVIDKVTDYLPEILRFSSWMRLICSTAWFLHIIKKCRRQYLAYLS